MKKHYLRMHISPSTIESVTNTAGKVVQTGLNVHGLKTNLELKKKIEKRERVKNQIETAGAVSSVISGLSSAIASLWRG